jgi:hypothetical protein
LGFALEALAGWPCSAGAGRAVTPILNLIFRAGCSHALLLSWVTWTIFVVYFAARLLLMSGGATWFGTGMVVQN